MNENIVLTKLAKDLSKYQNDNCDQISTFQYKGKEWVLLDAFKEDENNILDLIKTCETVKVKDFAFVPSDDGEYVIIVYRNIIRCSRHQISENLINQLLHIIYSHFQTRHIESAIHETKILKTYVTTTIFEALQKLHISSKTVSQQMLNTLALPAKFLPTLCEYQKKSVLWLLMRERDAYMFPAFFEKLQAKDNETVVYKHLYSQYIQTEPPPELCLPPGGILADEMGLGKTVEMLSLILLNPRIDLNQNEILWDFFEMAKSKRKNTKTKLFCVCTSNSMKNIIKCNKCSLWQHKRCVGHDNDYDDDIHKPYLCPCCWQIAIDECGLFKTKATFIVSPNTIKLQWLSEIRRHINPSLRVFLYDGILTGKWISPWELSSYDIVLTDYNVLRGEVYFTRDNVSERTTRNKPRSMRMNTPILMLDWWRVLLDEAQMVESNTSKVASLVRLIPANNRWAVTGTPIQKSLNDLQPLLQFIGFDAVSETATWNYLVNDFVLQQEQNNSEGGDNETVPELIKILQTCMWRTCKTQISSELKIPPQQEVIHRIEFNNLEKLFYNEQHAECRSNFMVNVNKYTKKMNTISPQIMKMILQPFLKIRQSCTIPVVINSSNNNNYNNVTSQQQKQFLQPKELHTYLKSTNEISCKTELRAMASSHNGLAGLFILQKDYEQAIKHYESVLKLAKDYNDMNIAVDSLLQIHALHNIMQIKIIFFPQTKDSFLATCENQYNALEWKYLGTYASTLATVKLSYEAAVDKINNEIEENFLTSMFSGLENLLPTDESLLVQKIHEECMPRFGDTNMKLFEIQSIRGVMYVVQLWFQKLIKISKAVRFEITALNYFSENVRSRNQVSPAIWREIMSLVNTVYDCHLSEIREVQKPNKKSKILEKKEKQICKMCSIRNSMNAFECLLFDKIIDKNTNYTEGLENPSFEMMLCKLTLNFLKSKHRESSEVMDKNWLYLENLQLVCKRLIKLWIEIEYTIKAYDELNMCKMRMSLTNDPDDKSIFKIRKNEIAGRILEQQNELMDAQTQFTVKLARLRYIKHLEGDDDPGACPICRHTEDDRYAVLECGHHICFPCFKSIRQYNKGSQFKCSICRNVQQNSNIYYVSRTKTKTSESEKIKGDYSSKITYIVCLILKLINEKQNSSQIASDIETNEDGNNDVKILIFSQWEPILLGIALALKENDITFRTQCTARTIEEFKNPNLGITCLLMPFIRGSKGLNLVEATHVFLVEPILNPGEELQAIGRVHRFGQTKTTTVHRFIVSDSIEENIYNFIVSSLSNSQGIQRRWEFDNISLKDFENLFALQEKN